MMAFNDFNNPQVRNLPEHLRQFIVEQHYEHYTPVDHAVWRYVMRQNYSYLKDVAYYPYIPGLAAAGLTIEKIPDLQEMNDALKKIGWGAVTVDGFIPPAAFMEYQSYRVLVIAAEIRQLHHIEYTPAPDIIHESAGHAPIIADKDYHEYLSYFGSIGAKAMYSSKDFELYEAIRELSILKELHDPDPALLRKAEKRVKFCQENLGEPSEMALLSRLHWWTVEYGLIGSLEDPKIYGAGLLSSIGESKTCMSPAVRKHWYTIDAVNFPFDITKPQPQLFVTPDFQNLIEVLEQFADTMAFRKGGTESILKAIECRNVCTAIYSSGIAVSGVFTDVGIGTGDETLFIKTTGPTALSYMEKELEGHGKSYHKDGFSSPVGRLVNYPNPLEDCTPAELSSLGIAEGQTASLKFEGGLEVSGRISEMLRLDSKLALISFTECTVSDEHGNILFKPEWGNYDMAVGENITSVYCGAADKESFAGDPMISRTSTPPPRLDDRSMAYHDLFRRVRTIRENDSGFEDLPDIWTSLKTHFREDWLCSLEVLELLEKKSIYPDLAREIQIDLEIKASNEPEYKKLIDDGFLLIRTPVKL